MWVELKEKHQDGEVWLARNKYEKSSFRVVYRLIDKEDDISVFCLADAQHIYMLVDEIWEEN